MPSCCTHKNGECGQPFAGPCEIKPWPKGQCMKLTDNELRLHDSIATEVNCIAGQQVDYFQIDIEGSEVDAVYDEPADREFIGPFNINMFVEWPDSVNEVREEGFRTSYSSRAWVARKHLEDNALRAPVEGDVVRFWKLPFFDSFAVDEVEAPDRGYFFDVVDIDHDGHLFDGPAFVGFWLVLQRRTDFSPERRLKA